MIMEIATVIDDGESQTVRLPKGIHLPTPTVAVRVEGKSVVLEPFGTQNWAEGFFDSIHITDPAFTRPELGTLTC
jgi:virulence-associated protein VagC